MRKEDGAASLSLEWATRNLQRIKRLSQSWRQNIERRELKASYLPISKQSAKPSFKKPRPKGENIASRKHTKCDRIFCAMLPEC